MCDLPSSLCHVIYLCHVCLCADDTVDLLHMLEQLSSPDRCGRVQGWECGGSVFLDYLRISKKFRELSSSENEPSEFDLENLHIGLKQLAVRIGQLPAGSPREV